LSIERLAALTEEAADLAFLSATQSPRRIADFLGHVGSHEGGLRDRRHQSSAPRLAIDAVLAAAGGDVQWCGRKFARLALGSTAPLIFVNAANGGARARIG
jgi:hypothetical protein